MARQYSKTRVQNFIRDLVLAAKFYPITYDGDNDDKGVVAEAIPDNEVRPQSVEVNQTAKEFATDSRYGRSLVRYPVEWTFEAIIKFNKEVDFDDLENVLRQVPTIPRDEANEHPQIDLEVSDIDYDEPTRKGSSGTRVTITFDANVERA